MHRFWRQITAICILLVAFNSTSGVANECRAEKPRAVIDSMLNLDVMGTDAKLAALEAQEPQHPLLDFLKAMAILNRAYTTSTIDRSVEEQALVPLIHAVESARARIQSGDNDPEVRLALGLSQAFVGSIYFAHEKSLKAYRYASAGQRTLEQLYAEHPEMTDALLGLGLFNYYLGSIDSKSMKWGAKMMGLKGDRELGLHYLEQAVETAPTVAPVAARVLLMEVDLPDEEKCKYASLAEQMRQDYPGNRIFDLIARIIPLQCRLLESEGGYTAGDAGLALSSACDSNPERTDFGESEFGVAPSIPVKSLGTDTGSFVIEYDSDPVVPDGSVVSDPVYYP